MATLSRGFDANERIRAYRDAVSSVHSELLMTKGFLGRTIQDERGLPSVGQHAARAIGVITDELGKLRCPPGTPNANQFTDMQMSNCLIPSPETIARQAAELAKTAIKKAVDGFRRGSLGPNTGTNDPLTEIRAVADITVPSAKGFTAFQPIPNGTNGISTADGAVKYLKDGGKISDVPDSHLIQAILELTNDSPLDQDSRFTRIGDGGGMHGMTRIKDKKTGALLGIKYPAGIVDGRHLDEPANELMATAILERMGFEPTPMRAVGGRYGKGVALITELVHNRRSGTIDSGLMARPTVKGSAHTLSYKVNTESAVSIWILDSVIDNPDRHEGNFLIERLDKGIDAIVPIDHSIAFANMNTNVTSADMSPRIGFVLRSQTIDQMTTEEDYISFTTSVGTILERMNAQNIDFDELTQSMQDAARVSYHLAGTEFKLEAKRAIDASVARLRFALESRPEEIAEAIFPFEIFQSQMLRRKIEAGDLAGSSLDSLATSAEIIEQSEALHVSARAEQDYVWA